MDKIETVDLEIEPNFPDGTSVQLVHFEPKTGEFVKHPPRIVGYTKTVRLETEPIFNIHIEFCDKSRPIDYFNLNLKRAADVLKEWSDEWILIPEEGCKLNGDWNWHANVRKTEKKSKDVEDYADVLDPEYIPEPCLEFMEPEE